MSKIKKNIPSVITIFNGLIGMLLIIYFLVSTNKDSKGLYYATLIIFFCWVLEKLDGLVARKFDAISMFGGKLGELVDIVIFGVLPCVFIIYYALITGYSGGILYLAIFAGCVFTIGAFIGIAKFEKAWVFSGLPFPPATLIVCSSVLIVINIKEYFRLSYEYSLYLDYGVFLYAILTGLALASKLPYPNLPQYYIENKRSKWHLVAYIIIGVIIGFDNWIFISFSIYFFSPPFRRFVVKNGKKIGGEI